MKTKRPFAPEFVARQIPRQGDAVGPLAPRMTAVRLPVEVDRIVHSVPEKAAWLRRVITEAAQRELMTCAELGLSVAEVRSRSKDGEV